jgi:hypothetical protein
MFVAGSAIFGAKDTSDTNNYDSVLAKFREQLALVK